MSKQRMPQGFTETQIREIAEHYDNIADDDLVDELEAAWAAEGTALLEVPRELVPTIEALIAAFEALRADHGEGAPAR